MCPSSFGGEQASFGILVTTLPSTDTKLSPVFSLQVYPQSPMHPLWTLSSS